MSSSIASDNLTLVIELDPEGEGGAYRIKNRPGEINRGNIVDTGRSLIIQANLVATIHGKLEKGGAPASLIITDFWFLPGKRSRRFTWARISYRVDALDPNAGGSGGLGPTVINIAPRGHFSLHPTKKHMDRERAAQIAVQAAAGPVNPGVTFGWTLKESFDTEDQITLAGSMRLEGRDFGGKNTARWDLNENECVESGIPTRLRTAILLERKPTQSAEKFQATVDIQVNADLISEAGFFMKKLFGKIPKDDPVIFDPAISTTSVEYKSENLAQEDLTKLSRVETTTKLGDDGTCNPGDGGRDQVNKDQTATDASGKGEGETVEGAGSG